MSSMDKDDEEATRLDIKFSIFKMLIHLCNNVGYSNPGPHSAYSFSDRLFTK